MSQQGYGEALGKQLFDIIEPFADYAFNKSHSYGYGLVAYQTAWLKANYPVEYLAALLSSVKGDKDKTAVYLAECRTLGIEVRVPDVNTSSSNFTTIRGTAQGQGSAGRDVIVFGLSAVRNVGEAIVEHIVAARERGGPFVDFYDFCRRVDSSALNKRAVESLAKAGAFDSLGHPRKGLCLAFEGIVERALVRRREARAGDRDPVLALRRTGRGRRGRRCARRQASTAPGWRSRTSSSTRASGWHSRRRCSACT